MSFRRSSSRAYSDTGTDETFEEAYEHQGSRRGRSDQVEIDELNRHVKQLKFRNPGKFMEDFDPERSTREMRKMNRRIYTDKGQRHGNLYDESGRLIADSRDTCDCLQKGCPGCHFPCPKCGSPKCGAECRCHRRWYYQDVEIEGSNQKLVFSPPPQ